MRLQSSEGLLLGWFTLAWQDGLAVWGRAQFLACGFSMGLLEGPHGMMTSFPHSKHSKGVRWKPNVFFNLISEVTIHHFCNILLATKVGLREEGTKLGCDY